VAFGLYMYTDALVICEPRFEDAKRTTLLNPRVVVEVLSESSEGYDRGDKFAHYRSIESVGDYVLVATTTRQVEVYTRGADAWELRVYREGAAVHLRSVNVRIPLDTLYRGVDLDPPYVHARLRRRSDAGARSARSRTGRGRSSAGTPRPSRRSASVPWSCAIESTGYHASVTGRPWARARRVQIAGDPARGRRGLPAFAGVFDTGKRAFRRRVRSSLRPIATIV